MFEFDFPEIDRRYLEACDRMRRARPVGKGALVEVLEFLFLHKPPETHCVCGGCGAYSFPVGGTECSECGFVMKR